MKIALVAGLTYFAFFRERATIGDGLIAIALAGAIAALEFV